MEKLQTTIQLRRGTADEWSAANPTPSAGEPCFETDTGVLKIGDGVTPYNDLPDINFHENIKEINKITDGDVAVWNTGASVAERAMTAADEALEYSIKKTQDTPRITTSIEENKLVVDLKEGSVISAFLSEDINTALEKADSAVWDVRLCVPDKTDAGVVNLEVNESSIGSVEVPGVKSALTAAESALDTANNAQNVSDNANETAHEALSTAKEALERTKNIAFSVEEDVIAMAINESSVATIPYTEITDRANGNKFRFYVENGVFGIEKI